MLAIGQMGDAAVILRESRGKLAFATLTALLQKHISYQKASFWAHTSRASKDI